MQDFIRFLKIKSVHVVGVTGAEGSNILRFLIKHKIKRITVHDYAEQNLLEENFKLWHKGLTGIENEKHFQQFLSDIKNTSVRWGKDYLSDISQAEFIFAPGSWRLYKQRNLPLYQAQKMHIPIFTLTKLYLQYAKAKIVAVTGTVGKGSVANLIVEALRQEGRKVYFAGNETWMVQLADRLDEMTRNDVLVLEISHRQLMDGIIKAPGIVVFTNIYPNHLDEMNYREYQKTKLSLLCAQTSGDYSVINYDNPILKEFSRKLRSKVLYYSEEDKKMNTENVQKIFRDLMSNNTTHYSINILAAVTALEILGIKPAQSIQYIKHINSLAARNQLIAKWNGVDIYDDIKSTNPYATKAAIDRLGTNTILICGGDTKGVDYRDFISFIKNHTKKVIGLASQLSKIIKNGNIAQFTEEENLSCAIFKAFKSADYGDNILISPAAGFFYTNFIKGKASIKKIVTSLPLKEKA